jgi:hypothetical protein
VTNEFDPAQGEWAPVPGNNRTVTIEVGPWNGDPGVAPIRPATPVPGIGDEAGAPAGTTLATTGW